MNVIHVTTRQDLLNDGELIPVPENILKDTKVRFPSAMTSALHAAIENMPEWEDYDGRVYDLMYMFTMAVSGRIPSKKIPYPLGEMLEYTFILNDSESKPEDEPKEFKVKAVVGPGDYPEDHPEDTPPPAVLTFMLPEED